MPILTEAQKGHIATVIKTKRKKFYGYAGGNRDLADLIGVSPQLLSMWASNKRTPARHELLKLSEVLDIPLDALYCLNRQDEKLNRGKEKTAASSVNLEEIHSSMLKICDITTDLVNRQRQMLHGELDPKEHRKMLSRIRKYVDIT